MATPVNFGEKTVDWIGPGDIGSLPAYRNENTGENISCWELTAEELAEVQRTGKVWLHVWGVHPPVCVSGESPFAVQEVEVTG